MLSTPGKPPTRTMSSSRAASPPARRKCIYLRGSADCRIIDVDSTDPEMFRLAGSGTSISKTWQYLLTGQTEALHDYIPEVRDPLMTTLTPAAEKGAFERPNAP